MREPGSCTGFRADADALGFLWESIASHQTVHSIAELKNAVQAGEAGDGFAVLDRNDLETATWRRVVLCTDGDAQAWHLKDEHGDVIDEPEHGCPAAGFDVDSLLLEIGTEYYDVPPVQHLGDPNGERLVPDGPNVLPDAGYHNT